jgi:DNA-binding HxlR family transcriptional regulator
MRARDLPDVIPPPDDCPLEDVIALLAGAWTIRILWYLCQRPRRFGELRRNLGEVRAKVLTQRLRTLEKRGLVARRPIASALREVEYSVTPLGRELEPVLDAMARVAARLPATVA